MFAMLAGARAGGGEPPTENAGSTDKKEGGKVKEKGLEARGGFEGLSRWGISRARRGKERRRGREMCAIHSEKM